MGDIVKFRKPSLQKKAEGKTLCKSGFHQVESRDRKEIRRKTGKAGHAAALRALRGRTDKTAVGWGERSEPQHINHAVNDYTMPAPSARTCSSHCLRLVSVEFFIGPTSVIRTGRTPQNSRMVFFIVLWPGRPKYQR